MIKPVCLTNYPNSLYFMEEEEEEDSPNHTLYRLFLCVVCGKYLDKSQLWALKTS